MSAIGSRGIWPPTVALALLTAAAPARRAGPSPAAADPWLPAQVMGDSAREVALDPSEARLARRRNVAIVKRRYGSGLVTAVRVTGGVREHHPASVCLRASGLGVVSRQERVSPQGCTTLWRVRRGNREATVASTYLGQDGQSRCGLGGRVLEQILARIRGRTSSFTHLQALDDDGERAQARLDAIRRALRKRSGA